MKRFKKIIFSICFILAFIFNINIKLFAANGYNIDNNGNIESLNIYKGNENNLRNYYEFDNLENSTDYTIYIYSSETYTYSEGHWYIRDLTTSTTLLDGILTNNAYTFTTPNTQHQIRMYFWGTFKNGTYECMINKGTTPLEYFPYGMYYNSSNTLNNNSYLSPFNIDYVESETFYINGILEQGEEPVGYGETYLFYDIEHTNAQGNNNWKSIVNFNRILPSMTILFKPNGNNFYHLYVYKNEELLYDRAVRYNENYEESDYYLTIPEFNRIELYCEIDNVSAPNQEIVLANTYEQGYTYGYSNGYNEGYAQGESSSYGSGYSTGYQKGIREANQNSLYNMILAIVDTPIHIFKGIFDFNVLGINLTNFVLSLISILIVVWLLKFFL